MCHRDTEQLCAAAEIWIRLNNFPLVSLDVSVVNVLMSLSRIYGGLHLHPRYCFNRITTVTYVCKCGRRWLLQSDESTERPWPFWNYEKMTFTADVFGQRKNILPVECHVSSVTEDSKYSKPEKTTTHKNDITKGNGNTAFYPSRNIKITYLKFLITILS